MITVSASLQAVLSAPANEPRWFVDIETGSGTWYVSNERLTFGGNSYEARLATIPEVQTALGPPGLVGPHDVSIDIANADGAYSQYRPEFFRGRMLTIKQGFREVDSEGVWQVKFKMTSARVVSPEVFRIEAGDLLTDARRMLIPSDSLTITRSMFLKIPEDSPGLGKPIPVSFGMALTPMHLVEEQASGISGAGARFVARLNGRFAVHGARFQLFNDELVQVDQSLIADALLPGVGSISIIAQASNPRIGGIGEIVPHYVALQRDLAVGGAGHMYPNLALLSILTDSRLGSLPGSTLVDSANWDAAQTQWTADATEFHGAMIEQKPLQDWLDDWAYASRAHLLFRDKIRIVIQAARSAVFSFHAGNILQGTLTYRDVPLEELETTQTLVYQQVMQITQAASAQVVDPFPRTRYTYTAGSGSTAVRETPFLGWEGAVSHCAEVWAKREAAGVREYALGSTVRAALVEEGDLVTLQHTLYCPQVQLCEVVGMRRGETVHFQLREASSLTFVRSTFAHQAFEPVARTAVVRYGGGETAINATPVTFTSSHPLTGMTPGLLHPRILPRFLVTTTTSLVSANNTEFTVAHASTASFNAGQNLQGWLVRV